MLNIYQVSKAFDGHQVLAYVNLRIDKGQIIGLAGPSGGGKSTLLRCMQGLETPDEGTIECQGKVGFMFQDFQLFPHMTVRGNLVYAPRLHKKSYEKEVEKMMKSLGILTKAEAYPHQLSGGQKQRVALARSLMMHPDVLLCDEPTSGLDVATTMDVVELLRSVKRTTVIASHDLDFLTKIADRIVVLKGGRIVEDIVPCALPNPIAHLKNYY